MITLWLLVGGGADNPDTRFIDPSLVRDGWTGLAGAVAQHVGPLLEACGSPKRVFLHNPFGMWPVGETPNAMVMDQERRAAADKSNALDKLLDTFKPAWAPLVRSGWEVCAYIGWDTSHSKPPLTRLNNIQDSLNRYLSTGCSIGFDSAAVRSRESLYSEPGIVRLLQALGAKCYVEGPPLAEWSDTPVIIDQTASDSWATLDPLTRQAETILRTVPDLHSIDAGMARAQDAVRRGYTAALDAGWLLYAGDAGRERVVREFGV